MKASFTKYPLDVILCMLLSILLLPIVLLDLNGTIRIILGLPFILFIPGYILIFSLFPSKKTDEGIDIIERVALSFGLSIAIVPLIGLALNYTSWGIRLEPVLLSIFIFVMGVGLFGIYRWFSLKPKQRFIVKFDVSFSKSESKVDKALTIILATSIIVAGAALVYVIITPKQGERFTEFYLLGPGGMADEYPSHLSLGENATGIVGIVNHEYRTINYTVEVWLLEQITVYNESSMENETMYTHMWFFDKTEITLDHAPLDIETAWAPQWEHNFSYALTKSGLGKLMFLLYANYTDEYLPGQDYVGIAEEKINTAYRELHLWLGITNSEFYLLSSDGTDETYVRNITVGDSVSGRLGIVNNELRVVNYTVDIWLVNQSTFYDEDLLENVTMIHNMWYLDGINVRLNHTEESLEWEQNYSVAINQTGRYKVIFFLFTIPTEGYLIGEDYKDRASFIFNAAQVDQSIWVNVT